MNVVLLSTYELGHQPFGLASPAAWLRRAGAHVTCLDLAVDVLLPEVITDAALIAFYLPMHTATRLALDLIQQLRRLNPQSHVCAYGLYAPLNAELLHGLGVQTLIGGEFEAALVALYEELGEDQASMKSAQTSALSASSIPPSAFQKRHATYTILEKLDFITPDRSDLLPLERYAALDMGTGERRLVGYTEASRGCKHQCRHCPIVPIYNGRFRIVARDIVLADIRQQLAAGAKHISFGDPDFFNGPGHAIPLVQALHAEHPQLSYDVIIKIEHILKHAELLPILRDTGCLFVTSAVESSDDHVLTIIDKRHTRENFVHAAALMRQLGLQLNPTFVTFTPWTTRAAYCDLLALIAELDLVEHVAPIQYAIRLLIPEGSKLLELAETQALIRPFDRQALCYPWLHPDPGMDALYEQLRGVVVQRGLSRREIFAQVWQLAHQSEALPGGLFDQASKPIPHLSEPWYC